MSASENKELLARYITEVWDEANLDAIRKFLSPTFERHLSPLLLAVDMDGQSDDGHAGSGGAWHGHRQRMALLARRRNSR